MICFTSDLHFGHTGIISMRNRPFADKGDKTNNSSHVAAAAVVLALRL